MGKEVTKIGQICQGLDKLEPSLNENLKGTGLSVGRFLATAKTAVQTHQQRDRLENADRNSLYLAIKAAATDGLMPDNKEAALVIYGNKVQYQPMVQGLVKLARQSDEIEAIGAYVVYENDKFTYRAGIDAIPQHDAEWFGDRGAPIGVWAFVKLKTGDYLDPVMLTRDRINRIASHSKQAKNYDPKNGNHWEEFWKKAAIRNVLKYAPKSSAVEKVLDKDVHEFEFDMEEPAPEPTPEATKKPKKKRQTKAQKVIKDEDPAIEEPPIIDVEVEEIKEEEIPV